MKKINTIMGIYNLFFSYAQYHTYCYVCYELKLTPIAFDDFLLRKEEKQW